MTTDPKPPRYIFRWHSLPQPPWAGSEVGAWEKAVLVMMNLALELNVDLTKREAEQFLCAHGEVVEVVR